MPEPRHTLPPDMAKSTRQPAALFIHWRRAGDANGELAVLSEVSTQAEGNERDGFRIAVTTLCAALRLVYADLVSDAVDAGDNHSYDTARRRASWQAGKAPTSPSSSWA